MRKGQQKIIEKAEKYGFCDEAIEKLKDESMTLKALEARFLLLYRPNEDPEEKKQAVEKLDEMLAFIDDIKQFSVYARSIPSFCSLINWEYIQDALIKWGNGEFPNGKISGKLDVYDYFWILKNFSDVEPPLTLDELHHILDEHLCNDFLTKYIQTYSLSILKQILDSRENYPELSIDDLIEIASIAAESGCLEKWDGYRRNKMKIVNFVKRVLNWERVGKTKEEIIGLQKAINNGEYDSICQQEIEKSYPGLFEMLDEMKKEEERKRQHIEINYLKENEIPFLSDSEDLVPYFDFCRSLPWKETPQINLHNCQATEHQPLFSTSTGGIILSYSVSLTGISFSIQSIQNVLFSKRRTWQQKDGKMDTGTFKENVILNIKRNKKNKEYFFTNDYQVLKRMHSGGWIPVPLAQFSQTYKEYQKSFGPIIQLYIDIQIKNGHYAWKDLKKYFSGTCVYPVMAPKITVEDLQKAHSYDEAVKAHYKSADFVNLGKADPNIAYMIMKSMNKVQENSKKELIKRRYTTIDDFNDLQDDIKITEFKNNAQFLTSIIMDNIKNRNEYPYGDSDLRETVNDYINITYHLLHQKIKLTFQSWKKLDEAHEEAWVEYTAKHTPTIKIPKKSKFNELRKMLPSDFEWIRTKKRIIEEGYNMHHCVATYAPDVNRDKCAIYSFVDSTSGNRYTIEFHVSRGKFYMNQIHGIWNCAAPDEIRNYVKSFLKN